MSSALAAADGPREYLAEALESLPAAIYVTDAEGHITFYNSACVSLAGRIPQLGRDRWCVTWKLFTQEGEPLPHERCPMATAILEKREVRGAEAIAERPDGSRFRFQPFPTPLFDAKGDLIGAINMLIDVTDRRRVDELRGQAARCRRLAGSTFDRQTIDALSTMADEYEGEADRLGRPH
ncbi:PAS domain-containing protein [Sphingomonas sp.]|uniref:PAS domain-containing protein n=1 Tax=Sphingomonas sp. TaxID=28214 RepID=UPI002ED8E314